LNRDKTVGEVANAKIVHMTSVHDLFDTRIFHRECSALRTAGYDLVLIAPHAHDEEIAGISVRAVPRAANRIMRILHTVPLVFYRAWRERAALYHFHDPELIPIGLLLKAAGKRVIYDVHEDLKSQILTKPWIWPPLAGIVARLSRAMERLGERSFDGLVAATPQIMDIFPSARSVTVQNFPDPTELGPGGSLPYAERPPQVAYVGSLTQVRGIVEMVSAMANLPPAVPAELVLAGRFAPLGLERSVRQEPGWQRVRYLGWCARAQVAEILGAARVGLVVLHPVPNYLDAYPVKLFEYMAAGIPVVASDFPLWRRIVTEAGCGMLVDPREPRQIAEAIAWLLGNPERAAQMGEAGREAVLSRFNWDSEGRKLLRFYHTLLADDNG